MDISIRWTRRWTPKVGPALPLSFELSLCKTDVTLRQTDTVKPVLSGHRIKRTPSIKRTVAEVPKFISLIYFK